MFVAYLDYPYEAVAAFIDESLFKLWCENHGFEFDSFTIEYHELNDDENVDHCCDYGSLTYVL